jgi:hypothetical protein
MAFGRCFQKELGNLKNDDDYKVPNRNSEDGNANVNIENQLIIIDNTQENNPTPPLDINVGISHNEQEFISMFVTGNVKHENFTRLSIAISNNEKVSKNHLQIKKSIKDFCHQYVCQTHKSCTFLHYLGLLTTIPGLV